MPDDGSLEFVLGRPSSRKLERRRPEERYAVEQAINLTPLLVLLLLANELYQPFAMAAQPYQVVLELGGVAAFDSGTMCTIQPSRSRCRRRTRRRCLAAADALLALARAASAGWPPPREIGGTLPKLLAALLPLVSLDSQPLALRGHQPVRDPRQASCCMRGRVPSADATRDAVESFGDVQVNIQLASCQ